MLVILLFQDVTDIRNNIITFFDKNPVMGAKYKDYSDFIRAAELIENPSPI